MPLSKIQTADMLDAPNLGRRNIVINGAMQIVQRGTVSGLTASSYGGPDRFRLGLSGAGTHRILQSATVPSGSGFANSWRLDCTTADTSITSSDQISCQYRIEGQDVQQLKKGTSSAEKVTLSFWVRSSLTGTYVLELMDEDNTRHIAKTYTISQADTFEHKILTFDGDTTGVLDNDNGRSFQIQWWLAAGATYTTGTLPTSWASRVDANRAVGHNVNLASSTDNNWYLTGVQLEVGDTATDFEHRSYGEELALCQRYYQRTQGTSSGYQNLATLTCYGTGTDQRGIIPFVTEMRAGPAISTTGNLMILGAGSGLSSINAGDGITTHMAGIRVNTTSNLSTGQSTLLRGSNDGTAHLKFDAEL